MSEGDAAWLVLGPVLWFAGPLGVGLLVVAVVEIAKRFRRR